MKKIKNILVKIYDKNQNFELIQSIENYDPFWATISCYLSSINNKK